MLEETKIRLTIVIPTKNRAKILGELLGSLRRLDGLDRIGPEIIVADNDSTDDTYNFVAAVATDFPAKIQVIKVAKPGKSAAINAAVKLARGEVLAEGPYATVSRNPAVVEAYVGTGHG